jgi:hypothetical protein
MNSTPRRFVVLLWVHILCAGTAAFALFGQEDLNARHVLLPSAGGVVVIAAILPAVWPYIFSFVRSKGVIPARAAYLVLYSTLLIVSTAGGVWLVSLSHAELKAAITIAIGISVLQALVFGFAISIVRDHAGRHGAAY